MTDESSRLPRHLAAILYADVVGFSRMTEQDEEVTYRLVRERLDLFTKLITAYGGEVMNYSGDAVLARFRSAENTLMCAARAQQEFAELNQPMPDDRKIVFRIGLNLGDIIEDRGDIFGNGVNVAARLEGLGKPGGICISGPFHDAVAGKLPFDYEFLGEQQVKNISTPVRAYHATLGVGARLPEPSIVSNAPASTGGSRKHISIGIGAVIVLAIALSIFFWRSVDNKPPASNPVASVKNGMPAIVVLPFINMSKDPAQEYFSDGITDDLIIELSGYKNLHVIARRSAYMYKSRQQGLQGIAAELGANYVLDGSVRRAGNRIRVNVQLVSAAEGTNIWAQQFNKEVTDLFKVQDEIRDSIIESLSIALTQEESARERRRHTNNFEAYDLFLQGQSKLVIRASAADNREAQALMEQAIKLDPQFARAHAALAMSHADAYRFDWSKDPEQTRQLALELAERAVELNDQLPQVHWVLGYVYLFLFEQHDKAIESAQRSLELTPNNLDAQTVLAVIYVYGDEPRKARLLMEEARQRNKHYPSQVPSIIGLASLVMGDNERALSAYNESLLINPSRVQGLAPKVIAFHRMGKHDEAEFQAFQLYAQHPDFNSAVWVARQPFKDKSINKGLEDDINKVIASAGL